MKIHLFNTSLPHRPFGRSTQINSGACRGLLDEVPKLIRVIVGDFWSPRGSRTPGPLRNLSFHDYLSKDAAQLVRAPPAGKRKRWVAVCPVDGCWQRGAQISAPY